MLILLVFVLFFILLGIRVPVGFAAGIAGTVGLYLIGGVDLVLAVLETTPYRASTTHALMTIPMFLLMAEFVLMSGLAKALFETTRVWVGRIPMGLGIATTLAGAIFAAVSGSSTASAATLSSTAVPQMVKHGYNQKLANGLVAVIGTIAMMIPPSIAMIIYAILTEQSVGRLLIAGFIPGILVALTIILTLLLLAWRDPSLAPDTESYPFLEKLRALKTTGPILLLFSLVTGVIYTGVATPAEASGLGAFGALLIAAFSGSLSQRAFREAFLRAASTSAMILMILVGIYILGYFFTATQVTQNLVAFVGSLDVSRWIILAIIVLIYIFLGTFMDQIATLVLTIPIVFPVIKFLEFDPIWFGVIIILTAEIGMLTPPLGLNVYVVARYTKRPVEEVFAGVAPFFVAFLLLIVLFCVFPGLVTWLPSTMSQ